MCVGEIEKKTLEHFYQNFNIRSVFVKTLSDKEKNEYICVCRGNRKKKTLEKLNIYCQSLLIFA